MFCRIYEWLFRFPQVTEIAANKLVAQDIVTQEVAKKLRELWTRKHRCFENKNLKNIILRN